MVVTLLAHRLSLHCAGTYTILQSMTTWVAFVTSSVGKAVVVVLAPLGSWALYCALWLTEVERHLALYTLCLRRSGG